MINRKTLWKPALGLVAVVAAFTLTFVRNEPNGLDVDIDTSSRAQAARNQDPYDLTQLQVLNRAILEVNEHYVEPERIDHPKMLLAGLNAIQRTVAPVIVRYEEGDPTLTLQVNDQRHEFPVAVNSPWSLSRRFREIFAFLQEHLNEEDVELRDIEYAAVNGMLSTLDPHTVLLTPDVFEEMQMSTRGEFGGLGIVISIRDGHLTIIRPMPNTPASRAGLQRGDRIVKINDESTLNMPLSEAVDRLRGPPGSSVTVWIKRKNDRGQYGRERRVDLVRAVIHIDSVESRMLADGVGYIKINSFQGNTYEDLRRALAELHREELRGLVLDLRDNPGGLLEQSVRVADTFLTSGTIVTTASNDPRQRDEKFAHAEGTEPNYPMVVLINGASASASEIVAGALKNHDRALVVGQRSFGKGSVQVLNNFPDGSALKLTVAQYLTPGDVSIQGVGIVPDIAIDPMTVDPEDMDLAVDPEAYLREADLRSALTNNRARQADRPSEVVRYYLDREMRQRLREADPNDQENEEEDEFLTRFSRQLLSRAPRPGRREMLTDAQPVLQAIRDEEMGKAVAELRRLGVDWSTGPDRGPSEVQVEVSTVPAGEVGRAGDPFALRVRVTNTGSAPLYRLTGTTKSDYRLFNGRELVFGRVNPGETKEWTTTLGVCTTDSETDRRVCALPKDTPARADGIRIEFEELHGHTPPPAEVRTRVEALPRPQFAYSLHVVDDVRANGDGRLQRGEHGSLYLHVRNVGEGRSYATHANLRNLSGRGVLLRDGRFRIDDMQPGEERVVHFTFEVLDDFERDEAKLEVSVIDADLRESVTEKVEVPVAGAAEDPHPRRGRVYLADGSVIHSRPEAESPVVARVVGGVAPVPAEAELGGFVRVRIGESEVGWVPTRALQSAGGGGRIDHLLNHMPPRLQVQDVALVTREPQLRLRGQARDEQLVRDLYIFAGARKVFYHSTRGQTDRHRANFDAEVPLHPGINYITVFAREDDDVISRRLLVVRRDGPDGSLLETPRFDEEFWDGAH